MSSPTKKDLENAKRFPWQWLVIILFGTIGTLFGLYQLRVKKGDDICEERVNNLKASNTKKDSIAFYWQSKCIQLYSELLYKNKILDRQQDVIEKTDSVARIKLEKPAKQIVKGHEH